MNDVLPPDVLQGAMLQGSEYGWSVSSFPDALASAEAHGYGCLGGQFQFRLYDGGTCEMYWLAADSKERADGESWPDYSHRSCSEVLNKFQHLMSATDFTKEASSWPFQIDPAKSLVFVAYFVTESELAELYKLSRTSHGVHNRVAKRASDGITNIPARAWIPFRNALPCGAMETTLQAEHEQATIKAFVVRGRQERFSSFLSTHKNRKKFTQELAHFRWFDGRFATPVPWKVDPSLKLWDRHLQGVENVCRLLRSKGAGQTCWVLSEESKLDGQELQLEWALESVVDNGIGTILSCIPGKLAYFEGEDESLLLAR